MKDSEKVIQRLNSDPSSPLFGKIKDEQSAAKEVAPLLAYLYGCKVIKDKDYIRAATQIISNYWEAVGKQPLNEISWEACFQFITAAQMFNKPIIKETFGELLHDRTIGKTETTLQN